MSVCSLNACCPHIPLEIWIFNSLRKSGGSSGEYRELGVLQETPHKQSTTGENRAHQQQSFTEIRHRSARRFAVHTAHSARSGVNALSRRTGETKQRSKRKRCGTFWRQFHSVSETSPYPKSLEHWRVANLVPTSSKQPPINPAPLV